MIWEDELGAAGRENSERAHSVQRPPPPFQCFLPRAAQICPVLGPFSPPLPEIGVLNPPRQFSGSWQARSEDYAGSREVPTAHSPSSEWGLAWARNSLEMWYSRLGQAAETAPCQMPPRHLLLALPSLPGALRTPSGPSPPKSGPPVTASWCLEPDLHGVAGQSPPLVLAPSLGPGATTRVEARGSLPPTTDLPGAGFATAPWAE